MCHAFERLRVIREYRSPRTIRSFTKVFIFLMPILLSPYYVHMGIKSGNTWSPYYIAVLTSFIFGTLQGVQDVLDDPFDGISADDINLGQVGSLFKRIQWTLSKSGFPPSRNFYVRKQVNFTRVNKIETMYGRSRVNVKVELRSTFKVTRCLSYIASFSFTRVNFLCVSTEKLRDSGNEP